MKKLLFLSMMLLTINYILALTAGDIAILAVNTDATKNMAFVALTDIPANTSISFSDNAWNATTPAWRTGEGTIKWNHTSAVSKGTVITLTFGSPFTASLGTVTSTGSFNLSADGDQVLVYEGTTAPSTNDASNWLWGFSTENFAWGNNSNTSDIPTALSGYSAAMTTSTTETDNAYFANSSTAQSSVSVSGTKSELITLFTNRDKYYKNNTGPLTIPTYTITISSSVTAPTTQASNITFSSVESTQMIVSWTNGNGAKRIVKMNTSNSFTNPGDGTDPTADDSWNNSGEQVIYNGSGNSVTVTNLSASTTYWFRVYEYNGSGTSTKYLNTTATNNPNNQITSTPPPNAPTATDATSVSYNKFTANWNSVSGATKYYLDVYTKGANATDLIISEYVEGSSNNKYLEIYNGTNNSIDLSGYKLQLYTNGSSTASTDNQLSGTLNSGQCIVYKNSSAVLTLPDGVTATTNSAVNFNGDDAVAIYKTSTKSYVDIFGRIGEDPGTAWTVGGNTTVDKTLVRKASVTSGITTNPSSGFPTLGTEWDMYNQDTASYLGSHTMNSGNLYVSGYQNKDVGNVTSYEVSGLEGDKTYYYVVRAYNEYGTSANSNEISVTTTSAPPPPTITVSTTELTGFGYVESSGPSSEKTFTISGSNLTANISIDAPTNYEISEDSGGSFSAEDPLVLTPSGGSVGVTTIYVRLKAGLSAGNYNNETITASSTGATSKTVTCSGTITPPPTITVSTTELTGFSYVESSGPSSEKTFTISGSNLTENISIDAPTDYEISKNSGDLFSAEDPLVLTPIEGSVSVTTIYVRLKAGLSAGNYNNENITASSTGATDKTVTCSGTVYKPEPSNHCSNFAADNGTDPKSQISLSWTDATGSVIPDGYLIKAATNSYDNITSPVDGTSETDGTYVKNVTAGVQAATFSNLNSNTTYYFKIFSYTNSGTNINYKTDGIIPQVSWTTAKDPAIVEIILPQYIQGLNGTNNQSLPWACRLKLENLTANATYRYFGQFVLSTDEATTNGAGNDWFVNSDNTITRSASLGMSDAGTYSEFTTDANGSYTGWFMGEPSGDVRFAPGNNLYYRIMLNDGNGGTSIVTRLTTANSVKVINFGTSTDVNQGTFLYGVSRSPAKNFLFVYDNVEGTGRPIAGSIIENDGLNLSGITSILGSYRTYVDNVSGAWGVIIPNSVGTKGFSGIKRVESRNLSDGSLYAQATDSDGVWPSGANTENPTGGDETPIVLDENDATLPVELSAFTANINSQGGITLMWATQSETGVNGFYVNRARVNDLSIAERISPLIPGSNTSQQQVYVYSDKEVYEPGTYYYWLEIQDIDGVVNYYGSRSVTFGGNGNNGTPDIPLVTGIRSIYPNPFNPSATIMYELEQPANLNIEIYNNRGQIVRSFELGQKEKGRFKLEWDGTDNSGNTCGTGIYFIKMQAGKESFVKKAALVK